MSPRVPVSALPMPRHGLSIHRSTEQRAYLLGPRPVVDAIGAASGLEVGDCADDQLGRIDHADEAVLHEAAARAGHHDVPWGCTLCEASRGGTCYAHRRTVTS